MKIVHVAPNSPYNDYWGYQDNLLPKYQKKLGHEVTVIITNTMHKDGKVVETQEADYRLKDGVRVIRRARKKAIHPVLTRLKAYMPVRDLLEEEQPDFIFFHGLISETIFDVVAYKKKHPHCVVVQDNHMDYNIGNGWGSLKEKIYRAYHRRVNRKSIPYVDRVYGVTPWRKTYAEDYFRIPRDKTDVLIMGADDEGIDFSARQSIRQSLRAQYGVQEEDFLVVTGGKIDRKKKIHLLMEACAKQKLKLLVFGQVNEDVKEDYERLVKENENIISVGWIAADKVYDYFFAADLVVFPGQHSVLWEQACAAKVPCVFERWEGMDHVNNGGNSDFVSPVTAETLREKLLELSGAEAYQRMKQVAESDATEIYLYSQIARRSLECVK
jgi:hypothetical protein